MGRLWKRFRMALAGLLGMIVVVAAYGVWQLRSMGFLRAPVFETERSELPPMDRPAVLVFSKTNAFIHREAIPAAQALLRQVAREQGWSILFSNSGAFFNPEDLRKFDVVVWNNVTGDVLLPVQREAFQSWLSDGGGYVGIHAAGDDSHRAWPWYQEEVIRARFIGHPANPQLQQAEMYLEQPVDPVVAGLPQSWVRTDEWYSFAASPRAAGVRVLATLDERTYQPGHRLGTRLAMGSDHPIMWKHCVGRGRVLYAAPGHTAETYAEPEYRMLLERAIAWAGRMVPFAAPESRECEDSGTTGDASHAGPT